MTIDLQAAADRRCGTCRWWDEARREVLSIAGGSHYGSPCSAPIPAWVDEPSPLLLGFSGTTCPTWEKKDG